MVEINNRYDTRMQAGCFGIQSLLYSPFAWNGLCGILKGCTLHIHLPPGIETKCILSLAVSP